ncbi:MAG: malto-oligosyltrehalose trehalohydrolase [Acidimicrobiales bacterium]
MTAFEVWAPSAGRVELASGTERLAMERSGQGAGWWRPVTAPGSQAGGAGLDHIRDYGFVIDGDGPFPDPRSRSQPHGVDGPSRTYDHGQFDWTDHEWTGIGLASAVIYEMHIGTFSPEGTFAGAIERLDHLVGLGVNVVELMPVAEFSGDRGWGYDGADLFAPHHAYGGPDGLKALVDACHALGLGVVLDVVYNHLGPHGNVLGHFGPYFTDRYTTPWGMAINFDGPGSDEVRAFFVDNALSWLADFHCDGLRLDAVHAIVDTSALNILEEIASAVDELSLRLGRRVFVIAESDLNDPRVVRPTSAGGFGIHAQWSDDFHHALHAVLTGEQQGYYADFGSLAALATALRNGFVYQGQFSAYRQRRHGRPAPDLEGWKLLGYSQDHDQVGNRALGDRTSMLLSPGRLAVAAGLVLTSPFTPMIFQGEEWGATTPFCYFTDHRDPALGQAVRNGRRAEFAAFGWEPGEIPDPQDRATFERSRLDWSELHSSDHARLLAWYRRLLELRRTIPGLSDGRRDLVTVVFDEQARWLVMHRHGVSVAVNLGPGQAILPCPGAKDVLASSDPSGHVVDSGLALGPDSLMVVGRD